MIRKEGRRIRARHTDHHFAHKVRDLSFIITFEDILDSNPGLLEHGIGHGIDA
jgi:hypothetical protein